MTLIELSIAAITLIIGVVILRALFLNNLPKITFPLLWGIVFIRLVLPFSFSTPYSLNIFLLQPFTPEATYYVSSPNTEHILNLSSEAFHHINAPLEYPDLAFNQTGILNSVTTNLLIDINWFSIIWLIGATLTLSFFMISHRKSIQKLKSAVPHQDSFLIQWQTTLQLRRPLKILISDQITTPLTFGLLRPKIILPADMDLQDELHLRYILSHELYHVKRWDALWKLLILFILCLHWFNPFVWVAFILINRDLEISCDAWVLKQFGVKTKKAYAQALLALAEHQNTLSPLHSSFARHAVEERIVSVMKNKKTSAIGIFAAIVVLGLLTFNAFAAAPENVEMENFDPLVAESSVIEDEDIDEVPVDEMESTIDQVEAEEDEASIPTLIPAESISTVTPIDEEDDTPIYGSTPVLSNLQDMTVTGMTVRAGPLFPHNLLDPYLEDDPYFLDEAIPLSRAVMIMLYALSDRYQFDADGLILMTSLITNSDGELHWTGWLLSADYDPTVSQPDFGYGPSNEQIHFVFTLCALTGQMLHIFDQVMG